MTEPSNNQRFWIAVASAEHARKGAEGDGFMQVCHGKGGPLHRISAGDGIVYYAPTHTFRGKDKLQCFILIGTVRDRDIYQHDMGNGFVPHRRNVDYLPAKDAPIHPMLDRLDFTRGKRNWGYAFRFGLLEIPRHDFACIADAMQADIQKLAA